VADADDPDDGRGLDGFLENMGRREVLAALGLTGVIGVSVGQSDSSKHLTEAENRFADLAAAINEADLVAPRTSERLTTQIVAARETAEDALAQSSEGDSETEQRRAALRAATDYYARLARTLDRANDLREALAGTEPVVLYHDGSVKFDPANDFETTDLGAAITTLADAAKDTDDVTPRDRRLLPDQQYVVDSLTHQRAILDRHIAAQQAYLDSATSIEAGVRAYEQSNFEAARTALTTARESLVDGTPETDHHYRLRSDSLSLGQYATLLSRRHKAVTRLLDVADAAVPVRERQSAADEALDLLFEARQMVTERG
jgi:hypothetical protein